MGRTVDDTEAKRLIFKANGVMKYPWHEWLNGGWWHLIEGTDYFSSTKAFAQRCYREQVRYGKITVRIVENGVLIKMVD